MINYKLAIINEKKEIHREEFYRGNPTGLSLFLLSESGWPGLEDFRMLVFGLKPNVSSEYQPHELKAVAIQEDGQINYEFHITNYELRHFLFPHFSKLGVSLGRRDKSHLYKSRGYSKG